jgi:hypothetical protein
VEYWVSNVRKKPVEKIPTLWAFEVSIMTDTTRQNLARWIAAEEGQFFERKSALDRSSEKAMNETGVNWLLKNNYKKGFLFEGPISYKYVNTCAVPLVRKEDAHNGRIFYCLDGMTAEGSFS